MSSLKSQEINGVLAVYFTDAKILDEARIQQIGKELMEMAASASESKKMLLNFQGVQFMSSAMIGKLVLLNKKCKKDEVTLKLCHISSNVLEVFKITRLNKVFDIYADECVDARVIDQLRRRGIDIITAADLGLLGVDDQTHLSRAIELGRVLLSGDQDFLALAKEWLDAGRAFPGLVFITPLARLGDVVRGVVLCAEVLDPADMTDWIEWVP